MSEGWIWKKTLNSATTLGRINIFHSHFFSAYFRSRETSPPIAAATAGAVDSKSNLLGGMMAASSLSLQYLEAGFRIRTPVFISCGSGSSILG
jgi:hypothetical protein